MKFIFKYHENKGYFGFTLHIYVLSGTLLGTNTHIFVGGREEGRKGKEGERDKDYKGRFNFFETF